MAKAEVGKWHPKLARFRTNIEKRTNIRDVYSTPSFEIPYINSGSTVLNMLIGGSRLANTGKFVCPGWPRGKIVEIFGRESSGKSTIAMTAMAHAIASNEGTGTGVYIDLECAVQDTYAVKLGVDFRDPSQGGSGQAIRLQPQNAEDTETIVGAAVHQGVDLIVIDSVAALIPRREQKRDASNEEEKKGVAEVPRFMSAWLPKLTAMIAKTKTCVIFLNQTRDKIGAKGFSEEALKSTTGGNALKFYSSVRMLLKPRMSTKAKVWNPIIKKFEDVQISEDIEVKMIKDKLDAKKGHSGLITIRYGVGIDELRTMLNVAEAYDIVTKKKNAKKQDVFSFKSPSTGHIVEATGLEKFRLAISRQEGGVLLQEMLSLATDRIMQGFKMLDDEELAALADDAVTKREDDDDDYEAGEPPEMVYEDGTDEEDSSGDESEPSAVTTIDV